MRVVATVVRYSLALLGVVACAGPDQPAQLAAPLPGTAQALPHPWTAPFGYGCNLGYYGPGRRDEQLAAAARAAGATTLRVSLPEQFVAHWGYDIRRPTFAYYADSLRLRGLVCFVGEPAPDHRDPVQYPGSPEPSKLFANLYEPIWLADSTVNPQNYFARYVYELVRRYGAQVQTWEVVNEPDYVHGRENERWLRHDPAPAELPNLRAPLPRYVRMLRITWEVVRHYQPTAYVTPGGLGYPEFLDALLRTTDNPCDGRVAPGYPAGGGAYFDALAFHAYPAYDLRRRAWSHLGRFAYQRHSDAAVQQVLAHAEAMRAVLRRYGYDGRRYPAKPLLLTETNVSRRPAGWRPGSDEFQRNFGLKLLVLAQPAGIGQVHFYQLGEGVPAPPPGTPVTGEVEFKLMGLYENLREPGPPRPTQLGQATRAAAAWLAGRPYNAAATTALRLPPTVRGGVFGTGAGQVAVLWAGTATDQRETARVTYSFPPGWPALVRHEWDELPGTPGQPCPARAVVLTGAPVFFGTADENTYAEKISTSVSIGSRPTYH